MSTYLRRPTSDNLKRYQNWKEDDTIADSSPIDHLFVTDAAPELPRKQSLSKRLGLSKIRAMIFDDLLGKKDVQEKQLKIMNSQITMREELKPLNAWQIAKGLKAIE